jgi:hypothetical protein
MHHGINPDRQSFIHHHSSSTTTTPQRHPYLAALPRREYLPLFWGEGELALLEGTGLAGGALEDRWGGWGVQGRLGVLVCKCWVWCVCFS